MKISKNFSCLLLLLNHNLRASELTEVDQVDKHQITTIYCHGLYGSANGYAAYKDRGFMQEPIAAIKFDDTQPFLGQADDIDRLKQEVDKYEKSILYGVSRGGSTVINYVADYNPDGVQALIIDASPADMVDFVDKYQCDYGFNFFWSRQAKEWALRQSYPNYPKSSTPPILAIAKISNKELPVFIVHSKEDDFVDVRSAWQHYIAFKQAGFLHVYLCELEKGVHAYNFKGPDAQIYLQHLHSFYKENNLPFNAYKASLSDASLLQPDVQYVCDRLQLNLSDRRKNIAMNLNLMMGAVLLVASLLKR